MNKDILVRMDIPIPTYEIVCTPAMIFSRWMPLLEDEFILVQEQKATLKLWFDRSCWGQWSSNIPTAEDISKHINVLVDKVFADVVLCDLSDGLVDYIELTASEHYPPSGPYQQEYRELGRRVYCLTMSYLNRFINYARSIKGQYWLQEYPIDEIGDLNLYRLNRTFNARVLIESKWVEWIPDAKQRLAFKRWDDCQNTKRFIDQDAWPQAQEFVVSNQRTSLVWELLAGAEWLAGIGHHRSSLTEAITALEVAISKFSNQPKADEAFSSLISERMNISSLKNQIDHLGLSSTVHYLFPVIFTETKIPTDILKTCQEAIQERQNVVHNAQRDVKRDRLSMYLEAIRKMCWLLESYSAIDT